MKVIFETLENSVEERSQITAQKCKEIEIIINMQTNKKDKRFGI